MKNLLSFFVVCLALVGCSGDKEATAPPATVDLKPYISILSDSTASSNVRSHAFSIILEHGSDEEVQRLIGLPGKLNQVSISTRIQEHPVNIVNVSYVAPEGQKLVHGIDLAPVTMDLHFVQAITVLKNLRDLSSRIKVPGLKGEQLEEVRTSTQRLNYVATAVLGAKDLSLLGTVAKDKLLVSENRRTEAAEILFELAKFLNTPENEVQELKSLVEIRLNLQP